MCRRCAAVTSPSLAQVLVAEDDRGVRESLVGALRFEGYDVRAVNDGSQALAAVDEQARRPPTTRRRPDPR